MRRRLVAFAFALVLGSSAIDAVAGLVDVAFADARHPHRSSHHRSTHHRSSRHRRHTHRRPPPRRRVPAPRPHVSPAYKRMRASWHAPPPPALRRAWLAKRPPPLVLRPAGASRSFELVPDAHGRFGEDALAVARQAFRYGANGAHRDIEPRLLELCYRAVRRFKAPYVTLVSGYRERKATSRHDQGRAMDIVLPGVSNDRLAAFLRPQGFVGVGVYPVSGFVHLDVRARSYFWIDRSSPNDPSQTEPTHASLVSRYDAEARRRGERPVADVVASASESDESVGPPVAAASLEGRQAEERTREETEVDGGVAISDGDGRLADDVSAQDDGDPPDAGGRFEATP